MDKTVKGVLNTAIGNYGGDYIADTNASTPTDGYIYQAIQVITDCSITLVGNISDITTVSLTAGTIIYGRYTSITLASGSVIGYYGLV